jgi:hypothetical protein
MDFPSELCIGYLHGTHAQANHLSGLDTRMDDMAEQRLHGTASNASGTRSCSEDLLYNWNGFVKDTIAC